MLSTCITMFFLFFSWFRAQCCPPALPFLFHCYTQKLYFEKNFWECWDSSLGRLGEKHESYLLTMPTSCNVVLKYLEHSRHLLGSNLLFQLHPLAQLHVPVGLQLLQHLPQLALLTLQFLARVLKPGHGKIVRGDPIDSYSSTGSPKGSLKKVGHLSPLQIIRVSTCGPQTVNSIDLALKYLVIVTSSPYFLLT